MKKSDRTGNGWLLIVLAAMTWGSDIIFRPPLTYAKVDPALIVFGEHLVLTIAFLPILINSRKELASLSLLQKAALLFIAWGASAIATWLYTLAFVYGSPLSAILLQKTQPLFALALAPKLLGERRKPYFWPLALLALVGAYLLAIGWVSPSIALVGSKVKAVTFALAAAALWGAGTIAGRLLSRVLSPLTIAAGRFSLALPLLTAALIIHPAAVFTIQHVNLRLAIDWIAIAVIPDIIGMSVYYFGMQNTPASIATLAELAYPATALLAGYFLLGEHLNMIQLAGLAILILAVEQIAAKKTIKDEPLPAASHTALEKG